MSKKTLCILGCGGFIGSHLLDRLLSEGRWKIIGVDTASSKITSRLDDPSFVFENVDIRDTGRVGRFIERSDTVVSLAALCIPSLYNTVPLKVIEHNFTLPYAIASMCSDLKKRLIHFSTCEVYGRTVESYVESAATETASPFFEDKTPLVLGPINAQRWTYACAKQLLERAMYAFHFERGLEFTIIRPFNFIGPRMDFIPGVDGEGIPRVVACFMEALIRRKPLQLVDGGKNRRTFTYIDDAIDAVVAVIDRGEQAAGQIFNVGNPENEVTIRELALRMKRLYERLAGPDRAGEIVTVGSEEFYGKGYEDCDRRIPDISKARRLLGWEPKTSLDTALDKTMKWFLKEYGGKDRLRRSGIV